MRVWQREGGKREREKKKKSMVLLLHSSPGACSAAAARISPRICSQKSVILHKLVLLPLVESIGHARSAAQGEGTLLLLLPPPLKADVK